MNSLQNELAAMSRADDAALAARIGSGDAGAFEELMRRENRRLFRVARALLRNDEEAQDALQEAYLCAFRSAAGYRGDAALATWVTRIVVNECMGRLRRSARRDNIVPMVAGQESARSQEEAMHEDPSASDDETPERAMLRGEMRALLEKKIDALPQDFRAVFVMRSVEELTVEETAACLGVPEATVRSRHFRARSLLRESIAQDLDVAERDVFGFDGERCNRIVARVLSAVGSGQQLPRFQ